MAHKIRIELVEEMPPRGRGATTPVEREIETIEIEVEDQAEGMDVLDGLGEYLETEGFDLGEREN